jgi:hypothetical protein
MTTKAEDVRKQVDEIECAIAGNRMDAMQSFTKLRLIISNLLDQPAKGEPIGKLTIDLDRWSMLGIRSAIEKCILPSGEYSVYLHPSPAQADWKHIANEWADEATNGPTYLRNVRDGLEKAEDLIGVMEQNFARIRSLSPAQAEQPVVSDGDVRRAHIVYARKFHGAPTNHSETLRAVLTDYASRKGSITTQAEPVK